MGKKTDRTDEIIRKAVQATVMSAQRAPKDAYKATEKRLYALPYMKQKLEDDREMLAELLEYGPRKKSASITRFTKSGVRLSPEEIFEAVKMDMEAAIASDEEEIREVEKAYTAIAGDHYAYCVAGRYFEDLDDETIAAELECDKTTVWRNRNRLVQRIAVLLYGAQALK